MRALRSHMTPLITLVLASFLARFGYQMARSPVLPRFAQDLGAAPEMLGLIVAASTITGVAIKLPAGALSDVLGRKRMMLLGCLFFAAPPFLYPFVYSASALLALWREAWLVRRRRRPGLYGGTPPQWPHSLLHRQLYDDLPDRGGPRPGSGHCDPLDHRASGGLSRGWSHGLRDGGLRDDLGYWGGCRTDSSWLPDRLPELRHGVHAHRCADGCGRPHLCDLCQGPSHCL